MKKYKEFGYKVTSATVTLHWTIPQSMGYVVRRTVSRTVGYGYGGIDIVIVIGKTVNLWK